MHLVPGRAAAAAAHTRTRPWKSGTIACHSGRGRRFIAAVALILATGSLTACATTDNNAFLGSPYDGPTAAYGYNLP
jgi:hypothetical protein